jgi:hypothetical protein
MFKGTKTIFDLFSFGIRKYENKIFLKNDNPVCPYLYTPDEGLQKWFKDSKADRMVFLMTPFLTSIVNLFRQLTPSYRFWFV